MPLKARYLWRVMNSQHFAFRWLVVLLSLVTLTCGGRVDESPSNGGATGAAGGACSTGCTTKAGGASGIRTTSTVDGGANSGGQSAAGTTGACVALRSAAAASWSSTIATNSLCNEKTDCTIGDFEPVCVHRPGECIPRAMRADKRDILKKEAADLCRPLVAAGCIENTSIIDCLGRAAYYALMCLDGVCFADQLL